LVYINILAKFKETFRPRNLLRAASQRLQSKRKLMLLVPWQMNKV